MRIGEVGDAVGLPSRTIRFYERRGLLPVPERAENGYRVYEQTTIERLRFIQSAQAAGLTLAEIGSIIDVRNGGIAPCSHVDQLLETKLVDVQHRRRELLLLEDELTRQLDKSRLLDPADCTDRDICHILGPSDR